MAASCGCRVLEPPCAHTGRPCRGAAHVCYRDPGCAVWACRLDRCDSAGSPGLHRPHASQLCELAVVFVFTLHWGFCSDDSPPQNGLDSLAKYGTSIPTSFTWEGVWLLISIEGSPFR